MNRRETLKALGIGSLSTGLFIEACKPKSSVTEIAATENDSTIDRQVSEIEKDKRLKAETFFTPHEMATITVLADIIIPKDEHSGSASDAKVPEFIEFIVKDIPDHQLPMRGGLRWLDMQTLKAYNKPFKDCTTTEQLQLVDQIAYPKKAAPHMLSGVAFFDRMRSLTASGFFTSKIGIEDVGYVGNRPNQWDGVPADILKQYGLENVGFNTPV